MTINVGYIESSRDDGIVRIRIYYDPAWLNVDPTRDFTLAPLINGPRGFCLDITNNSGRNAAVAILDGDGAEVLAKVTIGQGDPVTTGPANGRSRTAAQMASLGFTTRGDIRSLTLDW